MISIGEIKLPREIYVDAFREGCTIWTSDKEVLSIKGNMETIAEKIRNLVYIKHYNTRTNKVYFGQPVDVYIDKPLYGQGLKDHLENLGVKCKFINNGNKLEALMEQQQVEYTDNIFDML